MDSKYAIERMLEPRENNTPPKKEKRKNKNSYRGTVEALPASVNLIIDRKKLK